MKGKLQLLIVEDSVDDTALEVRALRRGGYDVTYHRVETPEGMLAALGQSRWDLVIADYSMPHFNGFDALKLLRARDPDLPFILISGTVGEEFAVQAVKAGANDYILKPNLIRLCQIVERELADAEARRAYRRFESRYQNLFNRVPVGVLFATRDGGILDANSILVSMLGLDNEIPESSEGPAAEEQRSRPPAPMNFKRFIKPSDHERFTELLEKAGSKASEDDFDLVTGEHRKVSIRLSASSPSGSKLEDACVVVTDISELKRTEELAIAARDAALELAKLRAELVANASHEICSPLTAIVCLTETLLGSEITDEQRTDLKTIGAAADNLLSIVNNILNSSRLSSGKLVLTNENFEIAPVFEHVIGVSAILARKKGIELGLKIEDGVPSSVCGDKLRLEQVVTNLVGNAIKFTARGSVTVKVAEESADDSTVTLRCEVKDTGIGIGPEGRQRLFQRYSQADGSVTKRFGGTGLGLAISAGLVTLMGGEIGVESEPGAGSTFWFTARLGKVEPAKVVESLPPQECPMEPGIEHQR